MKIQATARILYNAKGEPRVFHAEQADGSDKRLTDFLMWWSLNGQFPITVLEGIRMGSDDEHRQLHFFTIGKSKARTLVETPHGHAGALDFAVVRQWSGRSVMMTYTGEEKNDIDRNLAHKSMKTVGEAAEKFGLEWGGRFGDEDHLQVKGWQQLPFPPVLAAV